MSEVRVATSINGDAVEFLCEADETLLDVLRDPQHGLTGSKEGESSWNTGSTEGSRYPATTV